MLVRSGMLPDHVGPPRLTPVSGGHCLIPVKPEPRVDAKEPKTGQDLKKIKIKKKDKKQQQRSYCILTHTHMHVQVDNYDGP